MKRRARGLPIEDPSTGEVLNCGGNLRVSNPEVKLLGTPSPEVKLLGTPSPETRETNSFFQSLPIAKYADEIRDFLVRNREVALKSDTGTGKTLFLPYLFHQQFKIRVAIPTTVAVRSIFELYQEKTSIKVGFAAGRVNSYQENTPLVFGTTGHFFERLLNLFRKLGENGEIIVKELQQKAREILGDLFVIDEVHTQNMQTSGLMALINKIFNTDNRPMILCMTATLDLQEIRTFFPRIQILELSSRSFPVEIQYIPTNLVNNTILDILRTELLRWKNSRRKFHCIVFRPGVREIQVLREFLERSFGKNEPIDFLEAHSHLTPDDIDKIFKLSNEMKVIIGTNIIGMSVTIPDVEVVIDDSLVKTVQTSRGKKCLQLQQISKAESLQRSGRAGRTREGRVYRLLSREEWENLIEYPTREIDRVPIYQLILRFNEIGLDPAEVLLLDKGKVQFAERQLLEMGMIDTQGGVTDSGKFVARLPLSIQNSMIIYLSKTEETPQKYQTILALASLLEASDYGYFWIPLREKNEDTLSHDRRVEGHVKEYHEIFRSETDVHTLVRIFWSLIEFFNMKLEHTKEKKSYKSWVREFCAEHQLNNKSMWQMWVIFQDLLHSMGKELTLETPDDFGEVGDFAARVFSRAYFQNRLVRKASSKKKEIFVMLGEEIQYKLNKHGFHKIKNPREVIAGQLIEIKGEGGLTRIASILVDERYF